MKSFAARAFRVAFDEGGLHSVTPTAAPQRPCLDRLHIGSLLRDGELIDGESEPAVIDDDEVEQRWVAPGVASLEVRHSFVAAWRTRVVLSNLADADWVASFRLALRPGPGYRIWRLATGSAGVLALVPDAPGVPILYARTSASPLLIREGADPDLPADGLTIGPYRIGAGERIVLAWDWAGARHPRQLATDLSAALPALPRWCCVAVGEEIWLPADPDTALLVAAEVETTDLGDRQALAAVEPGRHRVELRSARGSTALDLSWVLPVPDFLAASAERVLSAPAGPAGVVRLPDLASAMVVQRVARTAGFPAAAAAADALDQFTARLDDAGAEPALRAVYLAGEYDRLGDSDLIARASEIVTGFTAPVPGLGLAVVRTTVASMLAGRMPATGPRLAPITSTIKLPANLAEAELLLSTRPPDLLANDTGVAALVHGLAIDVCAGLPGRLPDRQPPDRIAYTLAVLRLVPETLGAWWSTRFGATCGEWVDARSLELVERLGPQAPISDAHAWLALSS